MAQIRIDLDVLNAKDVVKQKKGAIIGAIANIFTQEDELKKKVEQKICEQIIGKLRDELNARLAEEGVIAKLHIETNA